MSKKFQIGRATLGIGKYANTPLFRVPVDYLEFVASEGFGDKTAQWLAREFLKAKAPKVASRLNSPAPEGNTGTQDEPLLDSGRQHLRLNDVAAVSGGVEKLATEVDDKDG